MPTPYHVTIIIGSLRKLSVTRRVANAFISLAPSSLTCEIQEISDLPLYNEDLEQSPPPSWTAFRNAITKADAILLFTPEYNRSTPAAIKNALDVGSRPPGHSVWNGKPTAVVSVTPFKLGGVAANLALRQALIYLNMPVMQQPESYVANAATLFDDTGTLTDADSRKIFTTFMTSFAHWVATINAGHASAPHADFDAFMTQRAKVASAYSSGDGSMLDAIVTREGAATTFPPRGGMVSGAADVAARYAADVKSFSPGSTTTLEVLQSGASGELAFWTGFQNFEGQIGGKQQTLRLRITELFRLVGGEWRLVHRHADRASTPEP